MLIGLTKRTKGWLFGYIYLQGEKLKTISGSIALAIREVMVSLPRYMV